MREHRAYEYLQIGFNLGDLTKLNRYAADRWHVVYVYENKDAKWSDYPLIALLERTLTV